MSITANVNGTLKTLTKITANVNGVIKEINIVHANINGTLKQIYNSKPQALTGTATCVSTTPKSIATNISIPTTCTVTFSATIAETPNYGTVGGRAFQSVDATGKKNEFAVTQNGATSMTATAVLPAGVYTFQMVVFNTHAGFYAYPTVTYTITFS